MKDRVRTVQARVTLKFPITIHDVEDGEDVQQLFLDEVRARLVSNCDMIGWVVEVNEE